jgi:GABA permease
MRRILVVANRTLHEDYLLDAIRSRMAEGPCEFTLLVPAVASTGADNSSPSSEGVEWRGAARQAGDYLLPHEENAQAHQRLEYGLARFRQLGATVDGEVGSSNAMHAIRDALQGREIDEILISTLPRGISQWLRQDLAHRARRKFRLPVTVVTPLEATGS